MAKDASLSVDAPRLPDTSRPGQNGGEWGKRPWTFEGVAVGDRDIPLPEVERKSVADKIWAWEQEQFPIKGPRLRLRARGFRPNLSISKILDWADAHFKATGKWPTARTGRVVASPYEETWGAINSALNQGRRGLPGGSSLGQLLAERRNVRPALTVERILAWADAYHEAKGQWPTRTSGAVQGVYRETWGGLDADLREGRRGLPGGSTLARVLAEHRGARNIHTIPRLTLEQILAWADAHHAASGRWPSFESGPVQGAPGESWGAINSALMEGRRGLPGASTLNRVLVENRGRAARNGRPDLTVEQILAWADAHHAAHGRWPVEESGAVEAAPGESWGAISLSLLYGRRGLTAGSSLARLLAEHRGARNPKALPPLTLVQILAWADAHHATHGQWPSGRSGQVPEAPGEDWKNIDMALRKGFRGLPGGTSLARLLTQRRPEQRRRLTVAKVRMWAELHRQATGRWPDSCAGPVFGAPGEDWQSIDQSLRHGRRGLPAGGSLRAMFGRSYDPAAKGRRPRLTIERVLAWGNAYHAAHGRWPNRTSGPIPGAPGEKWVNIDMALRHGRRGMPRGMSLAILFAQDRGAAASTESPQGVTELPRREVTCRLRAGRFPGSTGCWSARTIAAYSSVATQSVPAPAAASQRIRASASLMKR